MTFDFDRVIDRRTSDSNKWRKYPADVLPLWVADMAFPSRPAVVQALRARVEEGFFGYLMEKPELHEVVAERVAKRYDWRVSPDAIVPLPGVIAGFNPPPRAAPAWRRRSSRRSGAPPATTASRATSTRSRAAPAAATRWTSTRSR